MGSEMCIRDRPNNAELSVLGGVFHGVRYSTNFFIIYPEKSFVVFLVFYFNHLMQIAYKILSHCIYKCNLHPMLVVEILGTFYNV